MDAAVVLRTNVDAAALRHLAQRERDGWVAAWLVAWANVLDGMSREAAAWAAGMDRQKLRDCMIHFNADGVEGFGAQHRSGRPTRMIEARQAALKAVVLRIVDLCRLAEERFGVSSCESGRNYRNSQFPLPGSGT